MRIEPLPWDSEFFGFKTGKTKVEMAYELDPELLNSYELVYIFSDHELEKTERDVQISLQGRKVIYSMELTGLSPQISKDVHRYSNSSSDDLVDLGLQSGTYSRFFTDKNFPPGKFEEMYTTWVMRSINKEIADEVLIYEDGKGQPQGFVSIKLSKGIAIIGLLSVDRTTRGKGIGKSLIDGAVSYALNAGAEILYVATQESNKAACAFYQKCGFSIESIQYVYHFWKNKKVVNKN